MLKNNPNGSPSFTLLIPRSVLWRIIPVHNSVGVILVAVFYNSLLLKIRAQIWKHSYNRLWYKLPVWTHQMVPGLHASDWSHLQFGRNVKNKTKQKNHSNPCGGFVQLVLLQHSPEPYRDHVHIISQTTGRRERQCQKVYDLDNRQPLELSGRGSAHNSAPQRLAIKRNWFFSSLFLCSFLYCCSYTSPRADWRGAARDVRGNGGKQKRDEWEIRHLVTISTVKRWLPKGGVEGAQEIRREVKPRQPRENRVTHPPRRQEACVLWFRGKWGQLWLCCSPLLKWSSASHILYNILRSNRGTWAAVQHGGEQRLWLKASCRS